MGTPLKNPPLYLTLAKVRFNPLLKLAEFVPTIQEKMRLAGYLDYEEHHTFAIQSTLKDGGLVPMTVPHSRYDFGNTQETHTFMLGHQSLVLQSTNYRDFNTFLKCFLDGLQLIHDVVNLGFTEVVGLRYLDRITPQPGEKIGLYLAQEVHGLGSIMPGKPIHSYTEVMNQIDNIKLVSRVTIQDGPLAFPPDIAPGNLVVDQKLSGYNGPSAFLDNDGFVEHRDAFDTTTVQEHLKEIHKHIAAAFKKTATNHAFEVWRK
jgi:uncharacterized protein (TIGR04255 family)